MRLVDRIEQVVRERPHAVMIEVLSVEGPASSYRYEEIWSLVQALVAQLATCRRSAERLSVGIVMGNTPEWVISDLALLAGAATEIPVPLAFTAEQALHLLQQAELCLVDERGERQLAEWQRILPSSSWPVAKRVTLEAESTKHHPRAPIAEDSEAICKIVHTSGTTDRPKGVKIRERAVYELLASLEKRVARGAYARYLSLVPLSLLIEQVTALYMTFRDGGTLVLLPNSVALLGEPGATAQQMLPWIKKARASALTLPPALVEALRAAARGLSSSGHEELLRTLFATPECPFLACGGAPVAKESLEELWSWGVPVYEGYGLSENSSVVALNSPGQYKLGTVGKPLDHVEVRLSADNELLVKSRSLFAGYANTDPSSCSVDGEGWLHTGDIASIDDDGFVRVLGRKKHLIITAAGRNVCPEWVEAKYKTLDFVESVVLFGDELEQLCGVFVIAAGTDVAWAERRIREFGERHLSEVERTELLVVVPGDAALRAALFTVTGRPRRDLIWQSLVAARTSSIPRKHHV